LLAALISATAFGIRSVDTLSTANDWAVGIWKIRASPPPSVMMKMCQTSISPLTINTSMTKAREAKIT